MYKRVCFTTSSLSMSLCDDMDMKILQSVHFKNPYKNKFTWRYGLDGLGWSMPSYRVPVCARCLLCQVGEASKGSTHRLRSKTICRIWCWKMAFVLGVPMPKTFTWPAQLKPLQKRVKFRKVDFWSRKSITFFWWFGVDVPSRNVLKMNRRSQVYVKKYNMSQYQLKLEINQTQFWKP